MILQVIVRFEHIYSHTQAHVHIFENNHSAQKHMEIKTKFALRIRINIFYSLIKILFAKIKHM